MTITVVTIPEGRLDHSIVSSLGLYTYLSVQVGKCADHRIGRVHLSWIINLLPRLFAHIDVEQVAETTLALMYHRTIEVGRDGQVSNFCACLDGLPEQLSTAPRPPFIFQYLHRHFCLLWMLCELCLNSSLGVVI